MNKKLKKLITAIAASSLFSISIALIGKSADTIKKATPTAVIEKTGEPKKIFGVTKLVILDATIGKLNREISEWKLKCKKDKQKKACFHLKIYSRILRKKALELAKQAYVKGNETVAQQALDFEKRIEKKPGTALIAPTTLRKELDRLKNKI